MSELILKEYEISLWEDILKTNETSSYYEEQKICTIASSSMDTAAKAYNATLVTELNGANTLTFSILKSYYDNEIGEKIENPFVKLLVNERKVKLKYDNKWYDFIIKNNGTRNYNT